MNHSQSTGGEDPPRAAAPARSWALALGLYLALACLVALPGLGTTPLIKMEGMVADVSRAMLASGDYLVPRLYGEVYTYKPPLLYWLTALSIGGAGLDEGSLRLPAALSTVGLGLAVLLAVGALVRPRVGLVAGLAAITGMFFLSKARLAEFDAALASAIGIAVAAACYALAGESKRREIPWAICYLALATGVLIKGTPALMAFVPGLLAAAVLTGRWRELLRPAHLTGVALATATVGGYFWLLWQAAGCEAFAQPLAEARTRGLDWSVASLGRTVAKPFLIWLGFLPWSLLWFWGTPAAAPEQHATNRASELLLRAAWGFLAAGVFVFMAVPTQETRYYLPLAAPAAIVGALALDRSAAGSRAAFRAALSIALLCALVLVAAATADDFSGVERGVLGAVGALALALLYSLTRQRPRQRVVLALLVAAACGWVAEVWALRPLRARARDPRAAAAELATHLGAEEKVWVSGTPGEVGKHGPLYYYLDRPVRPFTVDDELPPEGARVILGSGEYTRFAGAAPAFVSRLVELDQVEYRRISLTLYQVVAPRAVF